MKKFFAALAGLVLALGVSAAAVPASAQNGSWSSVNSGGGAG